MAQRTEPTEFGGVLGTSLIIITMPVTILLINIACQQDACTVLDWPSFSTRWQDYFDPVAGIIVVAWFALNSVIAVSPIGYTVQGQPLVSGRRLQYRCNALQTLVISVLLFMLLIFLGVPVNQVYHKFLPLAVSAIIFSSLLSVILYIKSFFVSADELATGGNSGYLPYDLFMGRELNPRLGSLDLKFMCELRPGLIGWVLLDACFMVEAYDRYGYVPASLILVSAFHTIYVVDALWFEEAVLTTMDIIHEGFGFMLAVGDLAWLPFLYCLQARFLLEHPQIWSNSALVAFIILHVAGYTIFRASNLQKNRFRQDPNNPKVAHLKTMPTEAGKKLLVSGWWGMCRHPNYLGDLLLALAWALPCGFQHALPYFHPIYMLVLLVHRNARDEQSCRKKYGHDWTKYCNLVPYKIIPYIY